MSFITAIIHTIKNTALGRFIFAFILLFIAISYTYINCMKEVIGSNNYPNYNSLHEINGKLIPMHRHFVIEYINSNNKYSYTDKFGGYIGIYEDRGKYVSAKINNKKIVEVKVGKSIKFSYDDAICRTLQHKRLGKILLFISFILFIVLIILSLKTHKTLTDKTQSQAGS